MLLLLLSCNESEGDIRTPINPVKNDNNTTDYTLLHRKATGYLTDNHGLIFYKKNIRKEEKDRLNYISILRLPSNQAVILPKVLYEEEKKEGSDKLGSADNAYIDILYSMPNFKIVKKETLQDNYADRGLLFNSEIIQVRVYGLWQSPTKQPHDKRINFTNYLREKYEINCEKKSKITFGLYELQSTENSAKYSRCLNPTYNVYSMYDDQNILVGGGYCINGKTCLFEEWVNENRKINYIFNNLYFDKLEEISEFVRNIIKKSLVKDWPKVGK